MKKIKVLAVASVLFVSTLPLQAQLSSLEFLYGQTSDARILLENYLRPYANIMGANLNSGWYNTAKPHKLGGFDITATFSIAYAPTSALTYDLDNLGLNASVEGATPIAPTAAGSMDVRPELVFSKEVYNPVTDVAENYELARVTHPDGVGLDFLPLPMAQATIGLFKGTDLTLRYVPELRIGEYGRIGLFGIGGRHSVSQWIPVLNKLKFLNIAVQGGYTKVTTAAQLNMEPVAEVPVPNSPNWDDQFLNMDISGWTLNLIASQSIPVITVYEGIGYSSSLVDFAMLGHYPINAIVTTEGDDFGKTTYIIEKDPIPEGDMRIENFKNLRLNAGVRIKLALLTIHYDFTRTLYSTHTVGVGISFR
ncbi:MAG: DUF6588 family protein [Bacteroidales bacterium]